MIRKTTLAVALVFGLMLPACGGGGGPEGACQDLVAHILSVCDTNDAAHAALLEAFLDNMDMGDMSVEDLAADDGAAAVDECTSGLEDLEEWDQEVADDFIAELEQTTTCEEALAYAAYLEYI